MGKVEHSASVPLICILTNTNDDSDFDLYEEESESEDYELLYEAQQWEELQYFCK